MDSILTSIKKLLGPTEEDTSFDTDIIIYINGTLMRLNQLGIGPAEGYFITDKNQTWTDFIGDRKDLEAVKTYVYLKVKLLFDPPQSATLVEAIKSQIAELDWSLNHQAEGGTV
jgi:hypothetical protein